MITANLALVNHVGDVDARDALVADVRAGLSRTPKELPPRWFYDERGSMLFEAITELPEYYQTRTETAILRERAAEVVAAARPEVIIELGAGSASKTRTLLDAARRLGTVHTFVPFDVSEAITLATARSLVAEYPGLRVSAMVGTFADHLGEIPRLGRQLVVFLGSTIGNFDTGERAGFLAAVRSLLRDGDAFLLGVDLVKDRRELVAAYDDAAGVTADFNRNVLRVINRELGADFDVDAFAHVALFDEAHRRIEMHLRATRAMEVAIPGAGLRVQFIAGEMMRTEISVKFTRGAVEGELATAGMTLDGWLTDAAGRFALALAMPATR